MKMTIDQSNAGKRADRPHVLAFDLQVKQVDSLAEYFSVWQLKKDSEGTLCIVDPQGKLGAEFVNHGALFLMYQNGSDASDREVELRSWARRNGVTAPVINAEVTMLKSLSELAHYISDGHRQTASFIQQLATLREAHEELQNSYDELRTFVQDEGVVTPKVGFCNEPALDICIPTGARIVQQVIPTEMRRLSGVSLYNLADVPPESPGIVQIDLFSPSNEGIEYTWRQNVADFKKGWVTFAFEKRKGSFLRRNAALRVTYDPSNIVGPFFAFGSMKVQSSKTAIIDGQVQESALALRSWISLSGAPLSVSCQMWPTIRADRSPIGRLELTLDADLEVQDVLRMADRLDFRPILWDQNRRWIFVHPLGHSPTIARIADVCPKGTRRIIAEVETVHEDAAPVDYGIAVGNDDGNDQGVLPEAWTRLPAKVSSEIILELSRPLNRAHSLLLFTRIAQDALPDNCWAHFKRVYFEGEF